MSPEQIQRMTELENRVKQLEEYIANDKFMKTKDTIKYKQFTAGSAGTNGYISVEINGLDKKIMTTA